MNGYGLEYILDVASIVPRWIVDSNLGQNTQSSVQIKVSPNGFKALSFHFIIRLIVNSSKWPNLLLPLASTQINQFYPNSHERETMKEKKLG